MRSSTGEGTRNSTVRSGRRESVRVQSRVVRNMVLRGGERVRHLGWISLGARDLDFSFLTSRIYGSGWRPIPGCERFGFDGIVTHRLGLRGTATLGKVTCSRRRMKDQSTTFHDPAEAGAPRKVYGTRAAPSSVVCFFIFFLALGCSDAVGRRGVRFCRSARIFSSRGLVPRLMGRLLSGGV